MTLEIPFPREMEDKLRDCAAATGKDVATFVLDAVVEKLSAPVSFRKVFTPIHEAFAQGNVPEEALDQLLETALAASRQSQDNRGK